MKVSDEMYLSSGESVNIEEVYLSSEEIYLSSKTSLGRGLVVVESQ